MVAELDRAGVSRPETELPKLNYSELESGWEME